MPDALLDEILEEIELDEKSCVRCGRTLVTERHWLAADQAERWELWLDGYEAHPRGRNLRGRCNPCSFQDGPLRDGELEERDARRFRLLNYKALLEAGYTSRTEIADILGISPDGLRRNIKNWKERGQL